MGRAPLLMLGAVLAAGSARPTCAQGAGTGDVNAAAAYFAITSTPLGALPSMSGPPLGAERGVRVHGAFGYHDPAGAFSRRAYALGVDVPAAQTTVTLTAGLIDYACDAKEFVREASLPLSGFDCNHALMGGARWFAPLVAGGSVGVASATGTAAPRFALGVDASLGIASIDLGEMRIPTVAYPYGPAIGGAYGTLGMTGTAMTAGIGVPVALTGRTGGMTLTSYLAPRAAFGRLTSKSRAAGLGPDVAQLLDEESTESGSRFLLGGGLGIRFGDSAVGVDLGFQHVFVEQARTVIGMGVAYDRW